METRTGSGRQRWTLERRRKEPSLYDEWLNQEKPQQAQAPTPPPFRRDSETPLRHGSTTSVQPGQRESSGTIRAVTPAGSFSTTTTTTTDDDDGDGDGEGDASQDERAIVPEHETTTFERAFLPASARHPDGAPSPPPLVPGSPGPAVTVPVVHDREWEQDAHVGPTSPPNNRNGVRVLRNLTRRRSKNDGPLPSAFVALGGREGYDMSRPRTRTLEERTRRELSPSASTSVTNTPIAKNRTRIGSVSTSSSPNYQGAAYLTSVPAATSPPTPPSVAAMGLTMQSPVDMSGRRSISDDTSDTVGSAPTQLPPSSARRITHLMKTLNGRMGGTGQFRRGAGGTWNQSYCYVNDDSASLLYESKNNDGAHRTLIPELRGCYVRSCAENDTPYLEVTSPHSDLDVHLKLLTHADFEAWFAILLYWSSYDHNMEQSEPENVTSESNADDATSASAPEPPPRTSSARHRSRNGSKSERKQSIANTTKEAPVIKIGKMIFWDTNIGYSNAAAAVPPVGQISTARPQTQRSHSYATRRWQRISGQLRENGELKLHADADNNLISVVQLSQLSRCAIQRLDPSVLDNDFCIAIYPQYTSTGVSDPPNLHRPMFLSLESRVLYEVWFVLLRAFTIPQLYGPSSAAETVQNGHSDKEDLEDAVVTTTTDMFRVERSLNIRIIEAKMQPSTGGMIEPPLNASRNAPPTTKSEKHGHYAEVLLDNETRARTTVKSEGANPLWAENFEFFDLPPVLTSANVVIKRRPPDSSTSVQADGKAVPEVYGLAGDQNGGYTNPTFDTTVGTVEIYLQELEADKEVEKWWPLMTAAGFHVGDVLIRARADEGVILMARDYQPLSDLLHSFSNGITLQIAQLVSSDLKRLSDCLLNIYQVSGGATDWLMSLAEDEIDGLHKDSSMNRLRFNRRLGSNDANDGAVSSPGTERELLVREINKTATLEANLLFRGNTLLTKSLDTHMRRVGKEYLEESLAAIMNQINDKDPDCEVDPNRVTAPQDLDRNWRRLLLFTQEVWKSIVAAKRVCPLELRLIFRHIRACAEDRYGDFLRSVSYSSVSGFLFLRFFCPAVLNPKLFGLMKADVKPRARRTLTLIAKSLQTLANMASFGTKEHWMEPMNAFLTQHRDGFKTFIDDVCYVHAPVTSLSASTTNPAPAQYSPGVVSTETHLSYTTPMTIMQRLPPTSREGFPSLPYLIDQARAFADLVQLWLDATNPVAPPPGPVAPGRARGRLEIMQAIRESGEDLQLFHEMCTTLNARTQECLSRAERAERSHSAMSFHWDQVIDQFNHPQSESSDEHSNHGQMDALADKIASDASILPAGMDGREPPSVPSRPWETMAMTDEEDEGPPPHGTPIYMPTPPHGMSSSTSTTPRTYETTAAQTRPGSSGMTMNSIQNSFRRALASRSSDTRDSPSHSASASASNLSSAVNSDAEQLGNPNLNGGNPATPTALPSYEQEVLRHRQRREIAKQQILQQVEEAKIREREKKERKAKTALGALRKKKEKQREREKDKERERGEASNGNSNGNGHNNNGHGNNVQGFPASHRAGGVDFGGMI